MIRPAGYPSVPTRAIAVEQTHNLGGGGVVPLATLRELRAAADEAGVLLHCDGARIWHAHVADGVPLAAYGELFDTLSVCLSKGLGAPVGSLVVGSRERIAQARVLRKRMGGGMRQVGILAAAGRYALQHHVDRLADDHARARRLAEALAPLGVVDPAQVRTNLVLLDLAKSALDAPALAARAAEHDVHLAPMLPGLARLVTHLDVDDDAVERAAAVLDRGCSAQGLEQGDVGGVALVLDRRRLDDDRDAGGGRVGEQLGERPPRRSGPAPIVSCRSRVEPHVVLRVVGVDQLQAVPGRPWRPARPGSRSCRRGWPGRGRPPRRGRCRSRRPATGGSPTASR